MPRRPAPSTLSSPPPSSDPYKTPLHTELHPGQVGHTPTALHTLFQFAVPATGPVMKAMRDPLPSHPSHDRINVPRLWCLLHCARTPPSETHTHASGGTGSKWLASGGPLPSLSLRFLLWKEGSESDLTGRSDTAELASMLLITFKELFLLLTWAALVGLFGLFDE